MESNMLKINILLPCGGQNPVGGFKVIYEYANAFVQRGYNVTVVHPMILDGTDVHTYERLSTKAHYYKRRFTHEYRPDTWFKLHQKVKALWVPFLDQKFIPDADVVVATSWETAEWLNMYTPEKGRKFYLIQGLETWSGTQERVKATVMLQFHKIVIARWLEEFVASLGEPSTYIPNGLDFNAFSMNNLPADRDPATVIMLYHHADWKGSQDGLEALRLVKKQIPHLRVILFGVPDSPTNLEDWITYYQLPEQGLLCKLYNESAICLATSWTEGWGLVPCEAMMCGAATVMTDIGGHREFGINGETTLFSPPKTPAALAENVVRLIKNNDLRLKLAKQGNEYVQKFTWKKAVDAFEQVLKSE